MFLFIICFHDILADFVDFFAHVKDFLFDIVCFGVLF